MKNPDNAIHGDHAWAFLQQGIRDWWQEDERTFPWRTQSEEWRQLVTEVLLQRTRAEAVAQIYESFFTRFPSPEYLGNASIEEIEKEIYSLGLIWRARYLRELGVALATRKGETPEETEDLKKLPGVGPYVAGAMQVLHRNKQDAFVDANVVRLLGRYFGFEWDGETRRKKWFLQLVDRLFDHNYEPRTFGYALLDFTREICAPRPLCDICPLKDKCSFFQSIMNNQRHY